MNTTTGKESRYEGITYLNSISPFDLTINELRERNNWLESIPSKCQSCGFMMPDNTKMTHQNCDAIKPVYVENICAEHEYDCPCGECKEAA